VNYIDQLQYDLRAARRRYDELKRGETAPIRRCRNAGDLVLEPSYWRVGGSLAREQPHLAHVVLLFPLAAQRRALSPPFAFGQLLRRRLRGSASGPLRFRRLLASGDRDELDHRLRSLLRLACTDNTAIDWGVLGVDILWFFAERDNVRRRWAQDFYAPISDHNADGSASPTQNL